MTTITWLGGEENGDVAVNQWGRHRFIINVPLEVSDPHVIAKAHANRFYKVESGCGGGKVTEEVVADDPADDPPPAPERDPLDHDGDGKKGGSLPKAKRGRPPKAEK